MPRGSRILVAALVLTGALLALSSPAGATTYCVGVPDPGCTVEGSVQSALTAASADPAPPSLVELSSGTIPEDGLHYPAPAADHAVVIEGAAGSQPADQTVVTHSSGDPHPVIECQGGHLTLERIVVRAASGAPTPGVTADVGCVLTLDTGASIDSTLGTGPAVVVNGAATVTHATVTASNAAPGMQIAGAAATTIADSKVTGGDALLDLGPATVTAHRDILVAAGAANAAVMVQSAGADAALTIDDSVLRTSSGAQALHTVSGGAGHKASIVARQMTAVVGDAMAATPIWSHSDLGTAAISVYDSIASGYSQGVKLEGAGTAATIDLHHTALASPTVPSVSTGTVTYSHSDDVLDIATRPATFVNASGGDFHLAAGSTLVDEDATGLAAGESATDLLGQVRIANGKRDLGAIEHQPPTAAATVAATSTIGQSVAFTATGASDAGTPTFTWDYGDGGHGATTSSPHVYTLPGTYHWTLSVSDGEGTATTVTGTIVVSAAAPTTLTLAPDAITAAGAVLHGTVNPMGGATSYFFAYGPTPSYGQQTPVVAAGAGIAPVDATVTLSGLAPSQTYHERLVAVQGSLTVAGADHPFTTAAAAPVSKSSTPGTTKPGTSKSGTTKAGAGSGSSAKTARCRVPHLVGRTVAQARAALTKGHCRLGIVHRKRMRTHHGRVVSQQHTAGHFFAHNTRVGVTVGR